MIHDQKFDIYYNALIHPGVLTVCLNVSTPRGLIDGLVCSKMDVILQELTRFQNYIMTIAQSIFSYPKTYSHYFVSSGNFVAFRFDDIPFDFLKNKDLLCNAELAVMDLFIKKNQKLSLALVTKHLEQNQVLIKKIREGLEKSLFELAVHGWEHTDFSLMDGNQQIQLLFNAIKKVEAMFGIRSHVFIPPYNSFSTDTLMAMEKVGLQVISSELDLSHFSTINRQVEKANHNDRYRHIYHMPQMTGFERFRNHKLYRTGIKKIIKEIDINIARYGYAVVTLHPQSFMEVMNGKYNGNLDIQQMNNLAVLIDSLISRNIEIKTFSGVIQANQN